MRTKPVDGNVMDHAAPAVRRRPHAPPMASPFLEFDLTAEVQQLRRETTWNTGRNARTLVKHHDFRIVLTALQAHMRIPEHKTDGRISIHMLSGHIRRQAGRSERQRVAGRPVIDPVPLEPMPIDD